MASFHVCDAVMTRKTHELAENTEDVLLLGREKAALELRNLRFEWRP